MRNAFCLVLTLLLFAGCADKKQRGVNSAVAKAIRSFPGFRSQVGLTHTFNFAKSVRIAELGSEIQLFVQHGDTGGTEKIIVFINPDGESFAIPFPSNGYKAYWEFPFEKQMNYTPQGNSPFAQQLSSALDRVTSGRLHERELRDAILKELLTSVLNCRHLEERDSTLVYKTIYSNLTIPEESSDSAFVRLRKNYELMSKEWHPSQYMTNYNCYLDEQNARIYQIEYDKHGKFWGVKAYRQDYGFRHYTY